MPAGFSPDGRWLALCGGEEVLLVDVASGAAVATLPVGYSDSVLFTPSSDGVLTYGSERGLELRPLRPAPGRGDAWAVGPPRRLGVRPSSGKYNWMAEGRPGQVAVSLWGEAAAIVLDVDRPERKVRVNHSGARSVALSRDGRWLAVGNWQGQFVEVFDASSGARLAEFKDVPSSEASHVTFSPDGRQLVVATSFAYYFFRTGSWDVTRVVKRAETNLPLPAAYSPDGRLLVLCDTPRRARLLRADDLSEVATLPARPGVNLLGLQFSPDGTRLVLDDSNGAVLWDLSAVREGLERVGLAADFPTLPPSAPPGPRPVPVVTVEAGPDDPAEGVVAVLPAGERPAAGQIEGWIAQLDTNRAEDAATSLVKVGPPARDALTRALTEANDRRRERIQDILDRIEAAALATPRRVRLHLKDVPLADALRVVAKQTGLALTYVHSDKAEDAAPKRITLDLDDVTPWEALDAFARAAGLVHAPRDGRTLRLTPGRLPASGVAYAGLYRIQVVSTSRNLGVADAAAPGEKLTLSLSLQAEPRPYLVGVDDPARVEARDEAGQLLRWELPEPGPFDYRANNQSPLIPLQTKLEFLPGLARSTRLARLSGVLPVDVAIRERERLVVPDVTTSVGKVFAGRGRARLVVRGVQARGNVQLVGLALTGGAGWVYSPSQLRLTLTDAAGRPYRSFVPPLKPTPAQGVCPDDLAVFGVAPQAGFQAGLLWAGLATIDALFGEAEESWVGGTAQFVADEGVGPPHRLTLTTFQRRRVEVPFEFRDVPLP